MRGSIALMIISCFTFGTFAQKVDSVYQYIGYRGFNIGTEKIEKFNELPKNIQQLASSFANKRFGGYVPNISFVNAQIVPVDSLYNSDILDIDARNAVVAPVPYYDLNYSFVDTNLGIRQYWINIGMDNIGQVIYCNFPYLGTKKKQITPVYLAKEYADSIISQLHPETNMSEYVIDLDYSIDDDNLIWEICYLKESSLYRKEYCGLLINAHYNELVKQIDFFEVTFHTDGFNCCDTGIKLKIGE